jgi:hypothetical protein
VPTMSYYEYKLQSMLEDSSYKLHCDHYIMTDWSIHNNWPDIPLVLLDKTIKDAYLIYVAIPNSYTLHSTITEKHKKYTENRMRMWKLKMACIIPLVPSTMGNIPNKLHVIIEEL